MARSINDEADAAPSQGHNGPSHDDIRMAAHEVVKLQLERAAVNKKISTFRKGLKAKGFTLGVLDAVVTMLEWSPEEIKAHYAERDWYAEALRYPVGSQLEFFGGENTPDPIKEQLRFRNIGFKDGLAGRGWPNEAPDGCPPDCAQSYGEGHEEGSAVVRRAFLKRQEQIAAQAASSPEGDADAEDEAGANAHNEDLDPDEAARALKASGWARTGDEEQALESFDPLVVNGVSYKTKKLANEARAAAELAAADARELQAAE